MSLPRATPREKPLARDFNSIAEAVEQLQRIVGVSQAPPGGMAGLLLSMLGSKDRVLWCKITAAPPAGVPLLPSLCRYSYQSLDRGFVESNVLPKYGRLVENDECAIYPALVGDLCAVFRSPQDDGTYIAELMLFRENPAIGPCPPERPGVGGGGPPESGLLDSPGGSGSGAPGTGFEPTPGGGD